MKYYVCTIAIVALLNALACHKDDTSTSNPPSIPPALPYVEVFAPCDTSEGVAEALKITAPWVAEGDCWSYNSLGKKYWNIEMFTCDGLAYRERVAFFRIPNDNPIRRYVLTRLSAASEGSVRATYIRLTGDGHVPQDYYDLDTLALGDFLRIDVWDTLNKRAEGRFRVSFEVREPRNNPDNLEKVTFYQGKFHLRLPE